MNCHVTKRVLFVVVSIAPLYNERNHDFRHIFSKSFYIRFVFRRKTPPYLCNNPEIRRNDVSKMHENDIVELKKNVSNHTYIAFRMKFDQKTFSFKWNFSYFCPRECIDSCDALKYSNSHVGNRQIEWHTLNVFGWMHSHAVQFTASCCFQ